MSHKSQFHQHYMRGFYAIFLHQQVQTLNLITKKFRRKLSYEKAARKMLVKSTLWVVMLTKMGFCVI
jgi:hypothetical protein